MHAHDAKGKLFAQACPRIMIKHLPSVVIYMLNEFPTLHHRPFLGSGGSIWWPV